MTRAICFSLWTILGASLSWAQTDPLIPWIGYYSWPDYALVSPAYGTVSVGLTVSGSQSDEANNSYQISVNLVRTQTLATPPSGATVNSFNLSGGMQFVLNLFDMDGPCQQTISATVSGTDAGDSLDQLTLADYLESINVSAKLALARFNILALQHHGFNYSINYSGCDMDGTESGYYDDGSPFSPPPDQYVTLVSEALRAVGAEGPVRIPFYSNQNTAFAQAAQVAEAAGTDADGPLSSDIVEGYLESGWNGKITTGGFSVPVLNGMTMPVFAFNGSSTVNTQFGPKPYSGTLSVNWTLSGSPIPANDEPDDPCADPTGSDVGCQSQTLGENVPITGTPFSLRYSSDRAAGRTNANPVAAADALEFGGWTLSIHHAFDPSLGTFCAGGACSPPSSIPKTLFLGNGTSRSDAKVQSAVQANGNSYLTSPNGSEVYVFNALGQHLQTLRPMTGAIAYSFAYDAAGNLTSVTDGAGNLTRIDRDAGENPLDIVAPFGQKTTFTVNGNGYLNTITDPGGNTVTLSYNAMGLLTGMTDPNGGVFNFRYDSSGLLQQDNDPVGGSINLSRTNVNGGYVVAKTTALGRTTTYNTTLASTVGVSTTQSYANTLPGGQQTSSAEMQTSGQLSESSTLPNGAQYTYTYGPDPRFGIQSPVVIGATVAMGGLTMTTVGQRTAATSGAGPFNLTSQTDISTVNGRTYTSNFTASDRTYRDVSPQGRTLNVTLDALERVSATQIGALSPTTFSYDSNGRPSSIAQAGRITTFGYDGNGRMSLLITPVGQQNLTYDAVGNPASLAWADGRAVGYTYDANRNRTSVTPPGETAHVFTYTPVNLLASYIPPEAPGTGPTTYSYNADRQLTSVGLPDGQSIDYSYDNFGRMTSLESPTATIDYTYDSGGNLITAAISGGEELDWTYNGWLTTSETWSGAVSGTVVRGFDNNFRETSLALDGGAPLNFGYDLDGLLTAAGAETIQRSSNNGAVIGTSLGVVTDALTYDSLGELTAYAAQQNGAALYSSQYTFDSAGRISAKSESIGGASNTYAYTYDASGRVTSVIQNGSPVATYAYDNNSNRLGGTYDAQDRLLANSSATFTYSPNGELASKSVNGQTTTYTYDELDNLIASTLPDGTSIGYIVDPNNRRVGVTINGVLTTGFLYDSRQLVAQLDGNNAIVSQFIYGARHNVPDYVVTGGVTYRILSDQNGSPRLVVNTLTGAVVEQIDYAAFGHVLNDTNPGFQPFGFAGGLYDPNTKLLRFGSRDYFPETGRWTAKDPSRFAGGDTNLYAYAFNDPINKTDPTGLCPSLDELEDMASKWVQKKFSTVPVGPASVDVNNAQVTVGTSASIDVDGQTVVSVSAQAGVGLDTSSDPTGPIASFFGTLGAKIPSLTSLPLVGKYFSNSVTGTVTVGLAPWLINDVSQPATFHGCGMQNDEVVCQGQ